MSKVLSVHAVHKGGMRVHATDGTHEVLMDYPLQLNEKGDGLTPLQMLLASLAACSLNSLVFILKHRMNQPLKHLEVNVRALRAEQHPTVLTEIALEFLVNGAGVTSVAFAGALKLSEEQLCPVWNMLKSGTPISATFKILES